jgi:hypothetical protein
MDFLRLLRAAGTTVRLFELQFGGFFYVLRRTGKHVRLQSAPGLIERVDLKSGAPLCPRE